MATEDVLPKELNKLEITRTLRQVKLLDSNLPLQLNPFFQIDLKDSGNVNQDNQLTSTKTKPSPYLNKYRAANQNCRRCRFRRASESVLDELKYTSPTTFLVSVEGTRTPPSGVIKPAFKTGTSLAGCSGNRKVLLREPVLKALQTCLHPHSNVRRKLLAAATTTKAASSDGRINKGMSDFRDLIDECHNLLSEDVDFSGRLNQLCLSNRNLKNFTTIQSPKIQKHNKSRINRSIIVNTTALTLPSPETTTLNVDQHDYHSLSLLHPPLLGSNVSSTNLLQRNIRHLSPDQVSNPVRCNTTCSQEAGNLAAAAVCDDVTIDELASYFDTFVHIPKKMSSMAEMMYI